MKIFSNLTELNNLIRSGYALRTLYVLESEGNPPIVNISEFEGIIGLLEIHEAEVRRLRQNLSLHLRQHELKSYLEKLKQRGNDPEPPELLGKYFPEP